MSARDLRDLSDRRRARPMISYTALRSAIGICPGAELPSPTAKRQRRAEHAADHPRHGAERPHRHADERDPRPSASALRRRREHASARRRARAASPRPWRRRRRAAPPRGSAGPGSRAQAWSRSCDTSRMTRVLCPCAPSTTRRTCRRIVAHLEVEKIDQRAGADGIIETRPRPRRRSRWAGRPPCSSACVKMIGVSPTAARSALPGVEHGRRVADAFEIIDAPFDDVGLLGDDRRGFREHPLAGPRHQRRADQRRLPPSLRPLMSMAFAGFMICS